MNTTIATLLNKDWLEFKRDRLALNLCVVLPFVAFLLFGFGIRLNAKNTPVAIYDRDQTTISRNFIEFIQNTREFTFPKTIPDNPQEAVREGIASIIIPHGFGAGIESNRTTNIQAIIDGTEINQARATKLMLASLVPVFATRYEHPDLSTYYVLPSINITNNPTLNETAFIVPGAFAVLLWMFPSLLAAVGTSRDLEQASMLQMYTAKISATSFILGKWMFYIAVGLLQGVLLLFFALTIFHMPFPAYPLLFLPLTVLYISTAVAFGLFIGAITQAQTAAVQATSTGGFFPCLLLSGFVYPIENIPRAVKFFSYLVPTRYYISVVRNAFAYEVIGPNWVLCAFALVIFILVFLGFAWLKLRRMQLKEYA